MRAVGRSPKKLETVSADERAPVDLLRADGTQMQDIMRSVDAVISAAGASVAPELGAGRASYRAVDTALNVRLADAAAQAGVPRFVYVGVACADLLAHLEYVAAHEAVVTHLNQLDIEAHVVRGTGFFSAFAAILELAKKGSAPLLGDPEAKTNPIADEDLAQACLQALDEEGPTDRALGGPDVLTRRGIAELAFEVLGKQPRFVSAPDWAVRVGSTLVRPLSPRVSDITRFYLAVSKMDCVAERYGRRRLVDYFKALKDDM